MSSGARLFPVYDAIEYASVEHDRIFRERIQIRRRRQVVTHEARRRAAIVSMVINMRFRSPSMRSSAVSGFGGAIGFGIGRSDPVQSSSMPFPGMSIAFGDVCALRSSQSPPPKKGELPS